MVATASDSLSPVPQVAIATAAAGNRSLPAPPGAMGRTVYSSGYQTRT